MSLLRLAQTYSKKGRNYCSMCLKWHCHLEWPISPAVLLFCAPYKLRLSNSLPLQLIQHELSQASAEQYRGFPFHFRLSLLSSTAPPCSCLCCTPSPAHSTGCSWQKPRHTIKPVVPTRHNRDSGEQIKPAETLPKHQYLLIDSKNEEILAGRGEKA